MKKVLIFYGSYGGGHLSAARNIKEHIDLNYPENTETLVVDCIEYINKALNKVSTTAFKEISTNAHWAWKQLYYGAEKGTIYKISKAANRLMSIKLNKLIQEYNPDIIISTQPFCNHMCAYLKRKKKINCTLATVITDYKAHAQWVMYHKHVDYFFVAHEEMKNQLSSYKVSPEKIFATGIPLSNRFLANYDKEKILNEFGLEMGKTTILFFAGGEYGFGEDKTYNILRSLLENFWSMQVVAIAGKNAKMKERFDDMVTETNLSKSVKILEYTNKIPELMSISDLVITKPGGLTTTESIASGLPIIIINPIPGQEQENAEFLEEKGIGLWIKKDRDVEKSLKSILNSPEKLRNMKINARLAAKKNSTSDICKVLLENSK